MLAVAILVASGMVGLLAFNPSLLPASSTTAALEPGPPPVLAAVVPTPLPPTPVPTPRLPPLARRDAILPANRLVVYYGNPLAEIMGVLGEDTPEIMLERLRKQAQAFAEADPSRPVIPALSLVTPVAQFTPGPDNTYRARMKPELIEQVASWAERNSFLLFLDVQIGYSTVEEEVRFLLPYLKRPYVHLALDPEFAMPKGQIPGDQIGTMDAEQINQAVRILSDVAAAENIPPKVLIVHRFLEEMITNVDKIQLDPRVQLVIDMDGFGSPQVKSVKYDLFVREQRVQYSGIKLFYQHDKPLMTPKDVVELDPPPDVIIYQ